MAQNMTTTVRRLYGGFRGVDFRGDDIDLSRSPDALNVWKDYKQTDSISTRPGLELVSQFEEPVYGIFFYKAKEQMTLVHAGARLYKVLDGEKTVLYSGLREARSEAFIFNGLWYFKDGLHYLCFDGETVSEVVGFIPTTSIGRKPSGGGTIYDDVNLLSPYRKNSFLADGESRAYHLDVPGIDNLYPPVVTVNDAVMDSSKYVVDYASGCITFAEAPEKPLTDGRDNVFVQFRKAAEGSAEKILHCQILQVFDNRVFFSGNPDYPNTVWHCSLNDPSYCSDLDYYREGQDNAAVRALVAGNNALWAFREPSQANTTMFYHVPYTDPEYGKIYPSQHSSISTGCIGRAVNFGDDIVFFSDRGMEGISGDINTEQVLAHRSTLVDRKLTVEDGYKDMLLAEWGGYLIVFIGSHCYLADSRAMASIEGHSEYEWFFWDLGKDVLCTRVFDGVLYIGTADGVYSLTDFSGDVESHWVTPKDKFKYPSMQKTTNKRGCVVEALGDLSVSAKTDKSEFEEVGSFEGVSDYLVCRIKRKKFKDLQLKFQSNTRFSLETVTMEAFVGGYIKR